MSEKGSNPAFHRERSNASCASGKTQAGLVKNRFKPARKTLGLELVASPELLLNNEWREFGELKKTSKRFGRMPTLKLTSNTDLPTRKGDMAEKSSKRLNSSTALVRPLGPDIEATPASNKASREGSETRGLGSLLRKTGRKSSEHISKKIHSLSFRSKASKDAGVHSRNSSARLALASPSTIRDRRPNQRRVVEAAKSVKFAATNEEVRPKKPKHNRGRSAGNVVAPTSIMKASSFVGAPRLKQPLSQACYGDFLCNSASHSDIHDVRSVESRNRSLSRLQHLSSSAMPCRDVSAYGSEPNLSAAQQRSAPTTPGVMKIDTESSCSTSDSPKSVADDLLPLQALPSEDEDDDVDLNTIINTLSFEQRVSPSSNASDDTPRVTNKVEGGVNFAWLKNCVTECGVDKSSTKESDLDQTATETGKKNNPPSHQMSFESEIKMTASFSSVNSQARSLSKLQELSVKHRRSMSPLSLTEVTESQKMGTVRRCHIAETPSAPRNVESRGSFGVEDNATIASFLSRAKSQNLHHNDEVISSCPSNVELGLIEEDEGDELSGLPVVHLSRSRATSPVPEVGLLDNGTDEQEKPRNLERPSGRTPNDDAKASLSAVCDAGDNPEESIELDVNSLLGEEDVHLLIHESIPANIEEEFEFTMNSGGANDVDDVLGGDEVDGDFALGVDTLAVNELSSVGSASCDLDHQLNDAGGNLGNDASPSTTSATAEWDEFEKVREFEKLRSMDKLKELGIEHVKDSPNSTVIVSKHPESAFGVHPANLFGHGVFSEPLPPAEKIKTADLHRPGATLWDGPKSSQDILNSSIDDSTESNSLSVDCSTLSSSKGTKSTGGRTKSTASPPFSANGVDWDKDPACNGLSPVIEMLDYAFNGEDDETISDASSRSVDESDTSSFVRKNYKTKPKRRRRRYSKNSRRRRRRSKSSRQKSAPQIDLVYSPILELEGERNKASSELELIVERAPNRDYLVSFSPSTLEKELQTTEDVDLLNALLHDAPLTTISASAEESFSPDKWDDLPNLTTARARSSPNTNVSKSGETAAPSNATESLNKIDRISRSFRRIRTGYKESYSKL